MKAILVIDGLPDKALSPNARVHWAVRHRASQNLKTTACLEARSQCIPSSQKAVIQITYHVKGKRRRDGDNWLAMAKPILDGLVAAGVLPDDSSEHLQCLPVKFVLIGSYGLSVGLKPKTVIEIEEGEDK